MSFALEAARRTANKNSNDDRDILEQSLKRFKITSDSDSEAREKALFDIRFSVGEGQWDGAVKAAREIEGRPCLTVNRLPTFLRQYTGEERQHRPAMLVDPVGSGSDPETAEICQGVLRHIEVASFADTVYDSNYDFMLRGGWSNWRITDEFTSEMSFDREPRIRAIDNPFAVFMSPIRQPDGSDPLWCHVIEDMARDEYKAKYKRSKLAEYSMRFMNVLGNAEPMWVTRDGVRIAEYWWLELEPTTLYQLDDGTTCLKKDLGNRKYMIADERETVTRTVHCVKHNAIEVLEHYEYPGKYIPQVELSGVRLNINGKLYRAGMVRDSIDPQRLYNYMVTGEAEMISLAPKDPLLVPEGGIAGHEEEYRQANRKNYPYLYYKPYNQQGQQLPPPTRAGREPPIEALSKMVQQADYDLKSVIGIYGPGLGEQGPEQESGFAILTRQQQSDTGSVNWSDNLNRAIRWQGKILLDLFPKLISKERIQRTITRDDSTKHAVVFNSQISDLGDAQRLLDGKALNRVYDLGVGDYDVTLSSGPTYRTARQEQFRALTAVITSKPELLPMIGDIWAKSADWHGGRELAERFKKMLPANLQDQNDTDPAAQITMLQSQMQQLGAQQQQLVAELARASDTIRTKRLELESRERIAAMQVQAGMVEAALKANFAAGHEAMMAEIATVRHRMELLHESMSIEEDAGQAAPTPELPGQVEPKALPVKPGSAPPPIPGSTGGGPTL